MKFIIDYGFYFKDGSYESGRIIVKNAMNSVHAQIKLEAYLKKKHSNFNKLIVFKCIEDFLGVTDLLKNIF